MRPLLVTALFTCALASRRAEDHASISKVLRSWRHDKDIEVLEHPEAPSRLRRSNGFEKADHHRQKRSVSQASDASQVPSIKSCNTPGYTGQFCEFPICTEANAKLPYIPDDESTAVDAAVLANCSEAYVIYVDETMYDITINLEMDQPLNPIFSLKGEDGQLRTPDEVLTQSREQYQALFGFLFPGRYELMPSADLRTGSCVLSVRAHTSITINGGFVVGDGPGSETSDFPQLYTYFQQPASVVVHANALRGPAKLQTINFIGEQNILYRPRLLSSRYNCSYEYIFEMFFCKKTGSYLFQVEGVSFQGYSFRRLFPFSCLVNPATTPVPPSTPAPTQPSKCKNGGVLVKNLDGSTYCYCLGLFTGSDCSQRLCANGGTPNSSNKCLCADGFTGQFCENVYCKDNTGLSFDAEHPTLTLVIRTRQQLSGVISQVATAVQNLVSELSFDPEYLRRFVLVLFNNNTITTNSYGDVGQLLSALSAAAATKDSSGGCTDVDMDALSAALSQFLTTKSPVYVVTDALPSDAKDVDTVYHLNSDWRAPIHFIYIEPLVESGCTTSIEDPSYRVMDNVAQRTGGQTFYFQNRANVGNFLSTHMLNTLYRTQMLLSNDLPICSEQLVYKSVSVDSSIQMLVVVATGRNISLLLTNPDGAWVDAEVQYTDGLNYIWKYNGPHTGNWLFTVRSTDATQSCSFKVFQSMYFASGHEQQMDLFWSTTMNLASDVGFSQPLFGFGHAIVMHLTNYPVGVPPERVHASLTISTNRGGRPKEVYASNGIWRDACTYNFYFPPFTCTVPNELYHFNFFARDLYGFAVQRAGVMYCSEFVPSPTKPSACQNGGVMNAANTSCFCPPGFTGTYCEKIVCFNGGSVVANQCSCVVGWTGAFCEIPKCSNKGVSPEFMLGHVDMVFMVELTSQAYAQLLSLNTQFAEMIRDVQSQNQNWINRFYLVAFNSTWADVVAVSSSSDPHQVINELNRLAAKTPTDTGCRVKLWEGFEKVLRWNIPMGSLVEIFQTSPEDNSDMNSVGRLYDTLRSLYININGFLSYTPTFKPNGFACNATQDDYNTLFMMSGGSTGTVYPIQPGNTPDMVRTIPLQYLNAEVYGQWSFHCKQPMEVYFPVDAYTQTIQLNTWGYQKAVHLYDGNGKEVEGFSLLQDSFSGWDIIEVRKECDEGWDKFGQYCFQFVIQPKSFQDAQKHCHAAGASLVDDLNDKKHQFLADMAHGFDFWLGLSNNGSMYLWDRPDGISPLPLNQNDQYWLGGGAAPPYDSQNPCVFWNDSVTDGNTWVLSSCNLTRVFMCQKHQYDQNYHPTSIGDDDLPAGKWRATISVNPKAGQQEACSISVRAQTSLQIITGYTTEVSQDVPYLDPIGDSQTNRMITYIHSMDNAHRTPVLTHSLLFDAYNGTFYNAATYAMRAGCAFPWVSQTFACPNAQNDMNEFFIAHIGEDEFGNMFQRMTLAHCNKADLACGNGGIRYNGTCVCTEYWTGRYCTVPICVNGGVLSESETQCRCPKGYTGFNCQYEECTKQTPFTFSTDAKTLVLVVEATTQNMDAVNGLIAQLSSIVANATANHPNWFANYALVTFNSTDVTFSGKYSTIGALVMGLQSAASRASDPGKCTSPIYGALFKALSLSSIGYPNSEVFIVTMAGPSDDTARQDALELVSDNQAHVNFFYLTSQTCGRSPPNSILSPLVRLSYSSGGNVVFTDSPSLNKYLLAYLPTLYGTSVLTNPTLLSNFTCPSNDNWYVQVDKGTTSIFVSTTSQYGSIGVTNPLNQKMAANVLFSVDRSKLYEVDVDGLPGIYTLTLTSPGACYIHVYAAGGAKLFTEFSFTSPDDPLGSHQDGKYPDPTVGASNIATLHLYGKPGQEGILQYVEVYSPDTSETLLRSELYRRGRCSFEYYSDPFTCQTETLQLMVYGMDTFNQQFRRQELFFCHNKTSTTTLPPSTTAPLTSTTPPKKLTTPTSSPSASTPLIVTTSPKKVTTPTSSPSASTPLIVTTSPKKVTTPTPSPTLSSPSPSVTTTKKVTSTTAPSSSTSTAPPKSPTSTAAPALRFDVVFLIDVSQEAKNLLDDMTGFVASLMSAFDVSLTNARVALISVASAQGETALVASLNTIGSQTVLTSYLKTMRDYDDFDDPGQAIARALAMTENNDFKRAGYRGEIKNHLIVYVTATTKFDDDPQPMAQKILQAGTYGIVAVGYGPQATDQNALKNVSGGPNCTFVANDASSLLGTVPAVQALVKAADANGGKYCGN